MSFLFCFNHKHESYGIRSEIRNDYIYDLAREERIIPAAIEFEKAGMKILATDGTFKVLKNAGVKKIEKI